MALSVRSATTAFSRVATAARPAQRQFSVVVRAGGQINADIKKDVDKVVDMLKAEDLPKKAVFCRCWKSKKFPYCDGAHAKHNQETGDNVGPLIVEKAA
jgi:CDGSH-type Zn-finger protein